MASLSERLRRERELRGISLKQISDDTKIGVRFLEALEEDRLELIPGEFYRRSYLRAYARYLGLDEDRAVNAYAFANQEKEPEEGVGEDQTPFAMAPWVPWVLAAGVLVLVIVLFARSGPAPAPSVPRNAVPDASSGSPVASVANASVADTRAPSSDATAGGPPSAASTSTTSNPPATAAGATSEVPVLALPSEAARSRSTEPARSNDDGALRLVVSVGESCWLEIEADGRVVTTGLKEQGFRGEFSADSEVRLWLGNAGGVSLWVNDRPLRSLGRAGQVRKDLSITPDNYLNFVSAGSGPS